MTIKINWGLKIMLVYAGFVALILTLVFGASHQHFDLVSKDYYGDEIAYQDVIDAGKNQSALSSPVNLHATSNTVVIDFPATLNGKIIKGSIHFYSPVNSAWDKNYPINSENNSITISRDDLKNTLYTAKINFEADGKKYYQESEINLNQK